MNDSTVAFDSFLAAEPPSEGRLKLLVAAALCPFLPGWSARRTREIPLRQAAEVHVACVFLAILFLMAISVVWSSETFTTAAVRTSFSEFSRDLAKHWDEATLVILGTMLAVEAGFFALALLLMPWGAVDEPLRASFSHALRRVWCQSPHVWLAIVLIGLSAMGIDRLGDAWSAAHPVTYPQMPQPPPGMQPNTPESDAFDQVMDDYYREHNRIWLEARNAKPWYLRDEELVPFSLGFCCGLWFFVALLRAVGVYRAAPRSTRPPLCEECGYDLTLMPHDGRCPECGEPVVVSLGPEARLGAPWARREGGRLRAWWRTTCMAISNPFALGRMLRMRDPGTAHRVFLFMHLPVVFLVGAAALPALALAMRNVAPETGSGPPTPELLLVALVPGVLCTVGTLVLVLATASLRGLVHRVQDKRNLLPGAIQHCCYLAGYFVCWEVFGGATGIGAILLGLQEWFRDWFERYLPPEFAAFELWTISNLIWLLVYLRIARTGIAATRYANR